MRVIVYFDIEPSLPRPSETRTRSQQQATRRYP
jgi:hypothetical protein